MVMTNYCNRLFFENLKLTNIENVLLAALDAASDFKISILTTIRIC